MRVQISPQSCQHLLLFIFLILAPLDCCEMVSHHGFICIPLRTRDAEHLFMCLLAICVSPSEKWLFKFFAHFLSGLILLCNSSSYISWIRVPCQTHNLQIFSPILNLLFYPSSQVLQQTAYSLLRKENMNYNIFLKEHVAF